MPAARPALHLARTLLLSNCALALLRRLFLTSKWTWAVLCIGRMRVWPLIDQTYHLDFSNPWVTTIYIFVSALQPCQLLFPKIKISECKGEGGTSTQLQQVFFRCSLPTAMSISRSEILREKKLKNSCEVCGSHGRSVRGPERSVGGHERSVSGPGR